MTGLERCFKGKGGFHGESLIIPSEDIEKNESRWGNEYASISEEDIDALRNGNVIHMFVAGEYSIFIALRKN